MIHRDETGVGEVKRALSVMLLLAGVIWVLQGFDVGFAPKSFMTGEAQWIGWGASAIVAGLLIFWWDRKSG